MRWHIGSNWAMSGTCLKIGKNWYIHSFIVFNIELKKIKSSFLLQNLYTNQIHHSKQYCPYEWPRRMLVFPRNPPRSWKNTQNWVSSPNFEPILRKSMYLNGLVMKTILFRMMSLILIPNLKQIEYFQFLGFIINPIK